MVVPIIIVAPILTYGSANQHLLNNIKYEKIIDKQGITYRVYAVCIPHDIRHTTCNYCI